MPSFLPGHQTHSKPVRECLGSACDPSFWHNVTIQWNCAAMVFLLMLLLWWWGCHYIAGWLEKHDMRRDKEREKNLCKACLEHFLECRCRNLMLCGCAARQAKHARQEAKRARRRP